MSTCSSCGAPIVFLEKKDGGRMPVDAGTVQPGDTKWLQRAEHVSHFVTCPNREQHRKRPEGIPGQLSMFEAPEPAPASGEERLSAGVVTPRRAQEFRQLLASYGITGEAFQALRCAVGLSAPPEAWDDSTYIAVKALAIAAATERQGSPGWLAHYLRSRGVAEDTIAAAQAAFDAQAAGKEPVR